MTTNAKRHEPISPRLALVGESGSRQDTGEEIGEVLTSLEEKQRLLSQHVKLVARGHSNGLFVFGSVGGLGKSKVIQETLLTENASVVLLNSHVTALSLYQVMYMNQKGRVLSLGKASMPAHIDTKAHERACLLQALERHADSVKEQQAFWSKATGKSRASFFRVLSRYRAEGGGK